MKELSAKPKGSEFGVRLHDAHSMEILTFHFLAEKPDETVPGCMAADIAERQRASKNAFTVERLAAPTGVERARLSATGGYAAFLQMMGGHGQCAVIEVYPDKGATLDETAATAWLNSVTFDTNYAPTPMNKLFYAEILYRHEMFAAAAPMFKIALDALPASDLTIRRAATDEMGMALGMSGNVAEAREVFEKASAADPVYPLYQYNLACADAEEGKAGSARNHLQKAWELRANLLQGEKFPDPTKDDSLIKLKNDTAFWKLAQTISESIK